MTPLPVPIVTVEDAYFSVKRLVAYAGLSERTLRGYLVHPTCPIPAYKIGGRLLVRKSDYDAWAARFRSVAPVRSGTSARDFLRGV